MEQIPSSKQVEKKTIFSGEKTVILTSKMAKRRQNARVPFPKSQFSTT